MTLVPSSHFEKLAMQILWVMFQSFHGEILMLLIPVPSGHSLEIQGLPGSS